MNSKIQRLAWISVAALLAVVVIFHKQLVATYVERYPSVIVDRPPVLDKVRQLAVEQARMEMARANHATLDQFEQSLTDQGFQPIIGYSGAPDTVYVFTDYSCSACRSLSASILFLINGRPDLKLMILPVPGGGMIAERVAQYAMATSKRGAEMFAPRHSHFMTTRPAMDADAESLLTDADNNSGAALQLTETRAVLAKIRELSRTVGVSALPTLYHRGIPYVGATGLQSLNSALDKGNSLE